jgi:hypothetical protein
METNAAALAAIKLYESVGENDNIVVIRARF